MKSILYLLFAVIILGGVCVVTCPDHDTHSEALKNLLNKTLTAELSKDVSTEEDAGWAMFGSMIGAGIGGLVIDNILSVENYFVFTIRDKQVLQAAEGMFN